LIRPTVRKSPVGSHIIKIAFPVELPPKLAGFRLPPHLQQGPESELNRLTPGLKTGGEDGLRHEIFVDDDICRHDGRNNGVR
jgi:hypothetical protein